MKIECKNEKTNFGDLKTGTVFKYLDVIYMKIEPIQDIDDDIINAVSLEPGCVHCFSNSNVVFIVNCKLVIES